MIQSCSRIGQKSELPSDPPGSRLKLPSPTLNKKKEKEKKNKKYKKDQKRPQARLLQERCVHCHELFSQVEIVNLTKVGSLGVVLTVDCSE